jgi:hypothetical protein
MTSDTSEWGLETPIVAHMTGLRIAKPPVGGMAEDPEPFTGLHNWLLGEQEHCLRDIERYQSADQSYLEDGMRLIELAQNAQRLFAKQNAREKRRLLNFLVSNRSWRDGELTATLRQPFDIIAETKAIDAKRKTAGDVSNGLSEIWLPFVKRYRTRCRSPDSAFRLILEEIGKMTFFI